MKRQKWLTGILAVMLVASLLLAVAALALPTPARAAGELGSRGSWYEYRNCTACLFTDESCSSNIAKFCEYWRCIEYPDGPECTFVDWDYLCCYY